MNRVNPIGYEVDRIKYGTVSGAIGGFVAGFIFLFVFYVGDIIDSIRRGWFDLGYAFSYLSIAFGAGLVYMFLVGIAGYIKGSRKKYDLSLLSWIKTGFATLAIVSIPIIPVWLLVSMFIISGWYVYGDELQMLASLPVMYATGAFAGFIAGKMFQKLEHRHVVEEM